MSQLLDKLPSDIRDKYLGQTPVPVVSIATELGIDVFESGDFLADESGSIRREDSKYVIYINEKDPATRKRFTIAHEIGHFLFDRDVLDQGEEFVDDKRQQFGKNGELHRKKGSIVDPSLRQKEIIANNFAAELLMPEERFKTLWEELHDTEELARIFNVSVSAITVRAKILFGEAIL